MKARVLLAAVCLLGFACNKDASSSGDGEQKPAETKDADAKASDAKGEGGDAKEPATEPLPEAKLIEPLGGKAPPTNIAVALPPIPEFDAEAVPDTYPDGAWSIAGLRKDLDANVEDGNKGVEVQVRGYVTRIYVPPECPEGEVCPPAKQPHVWIADAADERGLKRAMMLVNYRFAIPEWDEKRWKGVEDVVLEKGRQYTFKGKLKQFSDTGFASDNGLLEFVAYKPINPDTYAEESRWVYPPGAAWHPIEIARQEEENAALAESMKKKLR